VVTALGTFTKRFLMRAGGRQPASVVRVAHLGAVVEHDAIGVDHLALEAELDRTSEPAIGDRPALVSLSD